MASFALNEDVVGTVFIGNTLLVLTAGKKIIGYEFDFARAEFK